MIDESPIQQTRAFNDTDRPFPDRATIHGLFEAQAARHASDVAVIADRVAESGDPAFLTYAALNERANQLANLLRSRGAGPDRVVAISLDRSFGMIVGILAILKAGAAYLPISPNNPTERTQYMLADSGARLLVVQKGTEARVEFEGEIIDLDSPEVHSADRGNPPASSQARDLAYVIYTSGSTGRPKGVMVEHRSVVNRLNWMQNAYPIADDDLILQKTPFTFDVSVWELLWWALYGAKMCWLRPGGEKNPLAIIDTVEKYRVTVVHFVPSMLNVFLEYLAGKGAQEVAKLRSLRRVFASGETLSPSHVRRFDGTLAAGTSARLTNLYGPTEATVDVTYFDCPPGQSLDRIPIGKPIDNTKIFILRDGGPVGIGEAGELCISGTGLARGYVNNQALTDEKFFASALLGGERVYRTGDIARWLPDGNIEYLGREDHQIKIRGLRIELGEIETNIREYPGVSDCIVISRKYSDSIDVIVAYVVGGVVVDELKNHLKERLPDYMVPNLFVKIDQIPLSPNGKADRNALPDPRVALRG